MRRLVLIALTALLAVPALALGSTNVTGRVSEYRLAPGTHAQSLVAGADGNIWFAGLNYGSAGVTDVLGRVTPRGKVTEFRLGTHAANVGLADVAVGPEGDLWFSEGGRARIGHSTVAGQITMFDVPTAGAGVSSLVAGADGNLWFSEEAANAVGRITPTGTATEFPLLIGGVRPSGIAAGADGALWVTEPLADTIARIGTDGTVTDFPVPDPARYPREIVAGPDSALWFGQVGASVIGRITTSGEITQFEVPGGRQTYALSWGPSGDLWYSNGGGRIGSITSGGETARPACIGSCRLPITSLAQGPEGKLWFAAGTEPGAPSNARGTIGTFAPPPLQAHILGSPQLRGHALRVEVRCDWGAAGNRCDGQLRLFARTGQARRLGPLSERALQLSLGEKRSLALRVPAAALRMLSASGRLVVVAQSVVAGGRSDARRVVLHQR